MGFWDILRGRKETAVRLDEIKSCELLELQTEAMARELAFWACVNKIAAAMGRCEVKVFQANEEVKNDEYYLWNIEPNKNQNSTNFWHRLVAKCYKDGAALIVDEPYGEGVTIADNWEEDTGRPVKVYRKIRIGNRTIARLDERDVLYIRPNDKYMEPIISALNQSFMQLMAAAMQNYLFDSGQHWKVHISGMANAKTEWLEEFQKMIQTQIKPFMSSGSAILPEFDGYDFQQISGGGKTSANSTEVQNTFENIFNTTARGFMIPAVLVNGKVEGTQDANTRFLSDVIDPLAEQMEEEINRKRYGRENWKAGNFVKVDTSSIVHFDMFSNASNVEKLIGSGAWSVNEVRKAAGYAPLPFAWANRHYLTLNISTMQEAIDRNESEERR